MKKQFNVHCVRDVSESTSRLREMRNHGFVVIGAEVPEGLQEKLSIDHNILHVGDQAACISALGFTELSYKNCVVICKPDLDALMVVSILRKVAYREPITEQELAKINLIAQHDNGAVLMEDELDTIQRIIGAVQEAKFYRKWEVVYNWLIGNLDLTKKAPKPKNVRQMIVENFGGILVVISFGLGAFSREFLRNYDFVIAVNPDASLMTNKRRGRRYCLGSHNFRDLTKIKGVLNENDKTGCWGGHEKTGIICSSPEKPSSLELYDIVALIKRCRTNTELEVTV